MAEQYKLVLVDDEDGVRARIASQISVDNGFEIVGKAANGHDALDIIEETRPDVVLTDIKMPFIDGIELARIIRRDYPTIRIAFITGYDEFEYAKKAVELRVIKYLMKPVTSEEINQFLLELKQTMDQEKAEKQNLLNVQEKYENLIPLIGDSFLSSLIHTSILTEYHLNNLASYGIMAKEFNGFQTCLIHINAMLDGTPYELDKWKLKTSELFKSIFKDVSFKHSLLVADGLLFIFTYDAHSKNDIDNKIIEVIATTKEYIDKGLRIGVSSRYNDFKSFPASYHESERALGYAGNYNLGNVVYYDEITTRSIKHVFITYQDYIAVNHILQFGNKESLHDTIHRVKSRLDTQQQIQEMEYLRVEIIHMIMYLAGEAEVPINELCDEDIMVCFNRINSIDALFETLELILNTILKNDIRKQMSRNEQMIQQAITFIEDNYQDNSLSLEQLSQFLNISISHLSTLFKKNSGYTFSKYLIKIRMEKAIELLTTTSLKIIDVAELCGYNDVYYFSHSFKRYTGLSPRKYANQ